MIFEVFMALILGYYAM